MTVNISLDKLENIIAGAWRIPMTKGKCAVATQEVQDLIDDIRLALPKEIKQAKIIVEDRNSILTDARQEAKNIINTAQKKAKYIISETNIVKQSKKASIKMLLEAKQKTSGMRQQTNQYIEELIENLEKVITTTAKDFKKSASEIRQIIKKNKHNFD